MGGTEGSREGGSADDEPVVRAFVPRPRRAEARHNQRAVMRMALHLIGERGAGVPVSAIAEAAGVTTPTVYRHFGSRRGLHDAVVDQQLGRLRRGVAARVSLEAQDDRPAASVVVAALATANSLLQQLRALAALMCDPDDGPARVEQTVGALGPTIDPLLTEAQRCGDLQSGIDTAHLVWVQRALLAIPDPEIRDRCRALLIRGLAAPARHPVLRRPDRSTTHR